MAFDYEVTALGSHAEIAISSELTIEEAEVASTTRAAPRRSARSRWCGRGVRRGPPRCSSSRPATAGCSSAGIEHSVETDAGVSVEASAEGDHAAVILLADLEPGQSLRLSKFAAYHWGDADQNGRWPRAPDARPRAPRGLRRRRGYAQAIVAEFWRRSDIEIEGAPEVQLAVRFNLFQLVQAPRAARVSACRRRA